MKYFKNKGFYLVIMGRFSHTKCRVHCLTCQEMHEIDWTKWRHLAHGKYRPILFACISIMFRGFKRGEPHFYLLYEFVSVENGSSFTMKGLLRPMLSLPSYTLHNNLPCGCSNVSTSYLVGMGDRYPQRQCLRQLRVSHSESSTGENSRAVTSE